MDRFHAMTITQTVSIAGDAALESADRAVARFTAQLRTVTDGSKNAIGDWSIAEVAAHVSLLYGIYPMMVRGAPSPVERIEDVGDVSASLLASYEERDLRVLADRVDEAWDEYAAAVKEVGSDAPLLWHGGIEMPVGALTCLLLGEALVHGLDVARAANKPWTIDKKDAALTFTGASVVLPHFLTDEGRQARASFRLGLRGNNQLTFRLAGGTLTVNDAYEGPVDCKISADPVAFLLVGYGRDPMWPAILKGKMVAYGPKPWLGLQFKRYMRNP